MEEKKISKFKENFNKIKEIYANRRYRALITLGLYFLFFIFVYLIISSGKPISETDNHLPSDMIRDFGAITNYEYTYEIEQTIDNEFIYFNITGERDLNKEVFIVENDSNNYFIENDEIYIIKDNKKEIILDNPIFTDLLKFRPNNIEKLISSSTLQATTTNHQQNTIIKTYSLTTKDFVKLHFNNEIDNEEDFISINVTEKDNNIIRIEIDFSNMKNNEEYKINFNKLEINYYNVGNVKEITNINSEQ